MRQDALTERFQEYFDVVPVIDDALLRRIFNLRYNVYCREYGYEREEDCPGRMEQDDYDHHALHAAVIHRSSQQVAGCVRLICPDRAGPGSVLPLERFCGHSLDHADLYPGGFPSHKICETSRLAVSAEFRRRPGEKDNALGIPGHFDAGNQDEMRSYPMISAALFLAAAALAASSERPHIFAMMEPRLNRLLAHSGLQFTQVGRVLDYHGTRAAFYIHHQVAMERMKPALHGLYCAVLEQLAGAARSNTPRLVC